MPTITEVLNRRGDLSTFVVHLTRIHDGGTGGENLRSILAGRDIEARSPMGWARDIASTLGGAAVESQKVVSSSETPLEHIYSLFADIPFRRVGLQPYGVAFTKMVARTKGVNPVWYVDMTPGRDWLIAKALDALRDEAASSNSFADHPAARILPFVEGMGTWPGSQKEFWWEREWRHVGDFNFSLEDVALVLCPRDGARCIRGPCWGEVRRSRLEPRADDRQARRSSGRGCESVQWVTACSPAISGEHWWEQSGTRRAAWDSLTRSWKPSLPSLRR